MFNKLCNICAKKCKQSDSVKIVSCPNFLKNPSEREFRQMVDELDFVETKAKRVQKRVKSIIKVAITGNSHAADNESVEGTSENQENGSET